MSSIISEILERLRVESLDDFDKKVESIIWGLLLIFGSGYSSIPPYVPPPPPSEPPMEIEPYHWLIRVFTFTFKEFGAVEPSATFMNMAMSYTVA